MQLTDRHPVPSHPAFTLCQRTLPGQHERSSRSGAHAREHMGGGHDWCNAVRHVRVARHANTLVYRKLNARLRSRLYGVTCAQMYFYYQFYSKDPLHTRVLVHLSTELWTSIIL
jgi:hypothetical protein